jgi:hypothetical protein
MAIENMHEKENTIQEINGGDLLYLLIQFLLFCTFSSPRRFIVIEVEE